MITITLGELVQLEPSLIRLAEQRLSAKTSYDIGKILHDVKDEIAHYEHERSTFIKECGVEREPSDEERLHGSVKVIEIPEDKRHDFTERMNEVAKIDVQLNVRHIKLDAIADAKISAMDINLLSPFIVE